MFFGWEENAIAQNHPDEGLFSTVCSEINLSAIDKLYHHTLYETRIEWNYTYCAQGFASLVKCLRCISKEISVDYGI